MLRKVRTKYTAVRRSPGVVVVVVVVERSFARIPILSYTSAQSRDECVLVAITSYSFTETEATTGYLTML